MSPGWTPHVDLFPVLFWTHLLCSWLDSLDLVHALAVPGVISGCGYQHPALTAVFSLCKTVPISELSACAGAALDCWLAFTWGAAH